MVIDRNSLRKPTKGMSLRPRTAPVPKTTPSVRKKRQRHTSSTAPIPALVAAPAPARVALRDPPDPLRIGSLESEEGMSVDVDLPPRSQSLARSDCSRNVVLSPSLSPIQIAGTPTPAEEATPHLGQHGPKRAETIHDADGPKYLDKAVQVPEPVSASTHPSLPLIYQSPLDTYDDVQEAFVHTGQSHGHGLEVHVKPDTNRQLGERSSSPSSTRTISPGFLPKRSSPHSPEAILSEKWSVRTPRSTNKGYISPPHPSVSPRVARPQLRIQPSAPPIQMPLSPAVHNLRFGARPPGAGVIHPVLRDEVAEGAERSHSLVTSPLSPGDSGGGFKAPRKRADDGQLAILNKVFENTWYPSTEERDDLARKLGMTSRSVQIWFQNRRRAIKVDHQSALERAEAEGRVHSHDV
ncbi:hypothetical protein CI109_104820 [Kwoniella shandongensis]|uniref:Uncharacterized protein n=1 Tax=Kwoniella shandongensis TaxID=1734106 RepID=A0A5M6BRI8_9TREE|nr:uncharacterized protein CI109_006199 [Kwoniella shandongensis]KAA5525508.1 hypothetical protein CI109_006199 [Kwoniella shandongensis]